MSESDPQNKLIAALGGIKTVFAALVLCIIFLGWSLSRIVATLDGTWTDSRLYLCLLLLGGMGLIVFLILKYKRSEPEMLVEPKVEETSIEDSEAG